MNVLLLILGLVLVIAGADCLVNGAVAVAKRYRMPEFLIGLTIVGIGTSMPELVVSLIAGIEGKGGMAIGNVVGSNLANTLLILGAASLIQPISISPATKRIDIPYNILVTLVLFFMCFGFTFRHYPTGGVITRWKGILLLALFAGYMAYSFRTATKGRTETAQAAETGSRPALWKSVLLILFGIAGLAFGGRWFVGGASGIALSLGVSETVIAITMVAVGTSLPELATAIVAAIKGNTQLALGNVIGSNIFNICLILGISSIVAPLDVTGLHPTDILAPLAAALMLLLSVYTFRGQRINRADGALFLALYIGYIAYLLLR